MYAKVLSDCMGRRGINQSDIATELGVSRSHINLIISGRRKASPKLIRKIIKVTGHCPACGLSVK